MSDKIDASTKITGISSFFGDFYTALQVAFICMKLGLGGSNDVMTWKWIWVFAPLWIPISIGIIVIFIWALICAASNKSILR